MNEQGGFEIEDEPALEPESAPAPVPPPATPTTGPVKPASRPGDEPLIGKRRRGRLVRLVPTLAVGFLLVGWICMGVHAWPFALTGAGVGVYGAWRRRSEIVLGSVAAVVGLATFFALVGFRPGIGMGIVIIGCGIVGFIAGLDDRMRGA